MEATRFSIVEAILCGCQVLGMCCKQGDYMLLWLSLNIRLPAVKCKVGSFHEPKMENALFVSFKT